ncbi:hypothetical protein B7463_g7642, partial [Scytalidium lignicola]
MSCKHINITELCSPRSDQAVYREDCTQCFDSIDDPTGLDVCLHCFNGGCTADRKHAELHYKARNHPLVLNIRRKRRNVVRNEPPQKMSKLAIAAETEADRYETETVIRCYECGVDIGDEASPKLLEVRDDIMKANTFSRHEEVKAWEQEWTSCEHILMLQQEDARQIQSQDLGHCSMCDLQENLWLCLQCGNLGCGRAQFGGLRGHSHALEHKNMSGHGVAVKLGSITPEGTADVYCYNCDEERLDEDLGIHLAHWGIILADRRKTEKSLVEMNVEENLRWEFSMTTEGGEELKRIFGVGFTGLKNLGNSCYLNSSLQCLFALPQFRERYYLPQAELPNVNDPAQDLETQIRKLADGLLSGRYSRPNPEVIPSQDPNEVAYQKGLAPAMFKHLVGRGHPEFSTMRQQDAFEFLLHLFKLIARSQHPSPYRDPTTAFRFVMEQRLQCLSCKKVRYRTDEQDNISIPVPIRKVDRPPPEADTSKEGAAVDEYEAVTLKECLDSFTSEEVVELTCPSCGSKDGFSKRSLFKTLPEVLAVNARRFVLINWVPTKVNVPVVVGDEPFLLDSYISPGQQPSEELLPEDANENKVSFVANPEAVGQLEAMGFPRNRCEKALHATGNSDANTAMEWLFAHMDDADIDAPLDLGNSGAASTAADPEKLELLGAMGFSVPHSRKALKETGGDMDRAVEWLFSHPDDQGDFEEEQSSSGNVKPGVPGRSDLPANFQLQSIICHKGGSIHAGHYVAFVRTEIPDEDAPAWVLFNDEKVVKAGDVEEMKKYAYVYFFRRV